MTLLADWLARGWICAAALAVLWAELVLLCALAPHPRQRLGQLLPNVLAGSCLLVALGLALTGASALAILVVLALSLVAHVADVASRLGPQASRLSRNTETLSSPATDTHRR
ncbi:hypothetical protein GWI72_00115 [Microvirga tunisiensis]|uniref:Uncharacterized protein n=2 Tax=Pannonibacter tanglangensis TaxID=2750084 RepID=A0ABW9ZEF5_9HYPH|nr:MULTISPECIES: hypothetical protein [unclassified Pannonibacter]NBN63101.1 hypothetical protein [Pannonibacter sp. XCT-34]NBN76666.1 hypothetical protein [Pannonibacter sp. XCT-53]